MGSYLDGAGLTQVWGKLKDKIDAAKEVKSLTKAEYDALEEKEQNVIYSVTDGEGDSATTSIWLNGEQINNNINIITLNCYSSKKQFEVFKYNSEGGWFDIYKDVSGTDLVSWDFEINEFVLVYLNYRNKDNNSLVFRGTFVCYMEADKTLLSSNNFYFSGGSNGFLYKVSLQNPNISSNNKHVSFNVQKVTIQADWDTYFESHSSFIKNKPNILKEYGAASYRNIDDNGNAIISTDSYIEICNWFSSTSAPHGVVPFTTILYVGRHTNNGPASTTTGSSESYCFSISFDYKNSFLDYNDTHPYHVVSVTQLNGSYTGLQKFTKLRVQVVNNYGYSIRLYYTKPSKFDTIKVLSIGEGKVINNLTVPDYSLGSTPSLYFDYDLTPGFKVWENNDLRIDSNKDITNVVYSPESKNALIDKSKSMFYTFTNYRNAISYMEDTGKVVGNGSDQKRIYKHIMTNPIEFEVGDVMIIPYISGYKNGEIYGNRLVKITSITNKENNYVIEGYPLNPVPTEYSENRMPDIGKGPVDVDYVIPVEENITATLKNSIISTTKPSHYWDWWIDNAPTNFYDSSSDYIIEGTNVSKFKKGDIIIIPSLTGSYQHVHSGNLLAEVLNVYKTTDVEVKTRIKFHIINYDFNDETGNYVGISLNNTEIKLYARL